MANRLYNDFDQKTVIGRMEDIGGRLEEEMSKDSSKRDTNREFELMYARFIAGLKLNTGMKLF